MWTLPSDAYYGLNTILCQGVEPYFLVNGAERDPLIVPYAPGLCGEPPAGSRQRGTCVRKRSLSLAASWMHRPACRSPREVGPPSVRESGRTPAEGSTSDRVLPPVARRRTCA